MKIVRQAAASILRTVIRLASPSTQNWAKAMLAELDSVGNDWAAFLWALGSVRILFVRQTIHPMGLSDIPAAAKVLADRMNQRTRLGSVSVSGMALFFGRAFLQHREQVQRRRPWRTRFVDRRAAQRHFHHKEATGPVADLARKLAPR